MNAADRTPFASATLPAHLLRGVIGFVAITGAVMLGANETLWWAIPAALGLAVVSLVAFRGCPICWTLGLAETSWRSWERFRGRG